MKLHEAPKGVDRISTKKLAVTGNELVVLNRAIEAHSIEIVLEEFHERPCVKLDLLGCQKSDCIGKRVVIFV